MLVNRSGGKRKYKLLVKIGKKAKKTFKKC